MKRITVLGKRYQLRAAFIMLLCFSQNYAYAAIEWMVPTSFCYTSSQNIACIPTIEAAAISACSTVGAASALSLVYSTPTVATPYFATAHCSYWNFSIVGYGICPPGYNYNPTSILCERNVPSCTPPMVLDSATNRCEQPKCVAPNSINSSNGQCEPPAYLTITLLGGRITEPATLLPFNAVVQNQNGVAQSGKQVTITVDVTSGTGGHIHTANRPKGTFTCASALGASSAACTLTTDYSGQTPFEFVATPVSGIHTITATCTGCSNTATAQVNVKVEDLIPIPAAPQLYALQDSAGTVIGAVAGKHTANHYLTSAAVGKLNSLAKLYTTKINPQAILYLNDASLTWGGLFDVGSSTPWSSPHSTHDKGRSLDIRAANSGSNNEGAVSATDFRKFIGQANGKGFKVGLHCKNSSDTNYCLGQPKNRHFHVDF